MRIRLIETMSTAVKGLVTGSLLLFAAIVPVAQNAAQDTEMIVTFDQDYMTPAIPGKQKNAVVELMKQEALTLQKKGYSVESDRNGEVVVVTIAADKLFAPNSVTLLPQAVSLLDVFTGYLRDGDKYKILLKMHSDNTGSEDYSYIITDDRIKSLYEFFDNRVADSSLLNGYPAGNVEPLVPNDSRENRSINRRLEIFIVPGPGLVQVQKNKNSKR